MSGCLLDVGGEVLGCGLRRLVGCCVDSFSVGSLENGGHVVSEVGGGIDMLVVIVLYDVCDPLLC